MSFSFAYPLFLLLLLALPLYAWRARRQQPQAVPFSQAGALRELAQPGIRWLAALPNGLRALAFALLILALAAPRTGSSVVNVDAEGIAIVLTVDISSSMLAEDLTLRGRDDGPARNRLAVAKQTVAEFIRGRRFDRIGLVAFAGEAMTQVPVTIDYTVILQALDQLRAGTDMLEDGTAIGTALATAANRLRSVPGESKVIILMTDGENNRGEIDPLTAARAAAAYDIRIYTIGVGSEGVAPIPIQSPLGVQYRNLPVSIDESLLRDIAGLSGGRYYRATNADALDSVYHEIDQLEKTSVEVRRYVQYSPRHMPFLTLALLALLVEWLLRASRWGRVP